MISPTGQLPVQNKEHARLVSMLVESAVLPPALSADLPSALKTSRSPRQPESFVLERQAPAASDRKLPGIAIGGSCKSSPNTLDSAESRAGKALPPSQRSFRLCRMPDQIPKDPLRESGEGHRKASGKSPRNEYRGNSREGPVP